MIRPDLLVTCRSYYEFTEKETQWDDIFDQADEFGISRIALGMWQDTGHLADMLKKHTIFGPRSVNANIVDYLLSKNQRVGIATGWQHRELNVFIPAADSECAHVMSWGMGYQSVATRGLPDNPDTCNKPRKWAPLTTFPNHPELMRMLIRWPLAPTLELKSVDTKPKTHFLVATTDTAFSSLPQGIYTVSAPLTAPAYEHTREELSTYVDTCGIPFRYDWQVDVPDHWYKYDDLARSLVSIRERTESIKEGYQEFTAGHIDPAWHTKSERLHEHAASLVQEVIDRQVKSVESVWCGDATAELLAHTDEICSQNHVPLGADVQEVLRVGMFGSGSEVSA